MGRTALYAIIAVVIVAIVGATALYFYSSPRAPVTPTTSPATTPARQYSFKMPTGSPTGTYYIAAQAIAAIVSKYSPEITVVAIPGGGSVSNCRAVGKGDVPISLSTALVAHYAYNGLEPFFKNESYGKLRFVAPIHPLIVGFIVRADSGIKTVYDLVGKRVAVGEPGSGDAVVSEIILREAGIWDRVVKVNVGDPESWDLFKGGQVDAFIHHTIVPNPSIYEMSMRTPLTFVEIPDELANKIIGKYGFFSQVVVPKGSYTGMDRDVKVLKVPSIIIANADAPEDLVYKFVKAYWEHFDEVVVMASFLKAVDRDNPFAGVTLPLHPGAYKYFSEKGYKIPESLKPK
jgi:TRAP transporter TAXI family solute receptor